MYRPISLFVLSRNVKGGQMLEAEAEVEVEVEARTLTLRSRPSQI